ncbi:hypothetical protein ORJ04_03115 [Rheinheimera baltica]|uniref:General secretion pathway protein D n=1 Tax=Rheinheimera baltica TaxID=67576 RepID=A0ABT9HUY6_9GAMM|nr:secretin N-terminal domain-containing protein [Rheinheimera baltica]MDP5134935.1 hypothetical protein [Rheinheimera baltica]MDP5149814.1 hypothetical protein [Rheinheimera baltica]
MSVLSGANKVPAALNSLHTKSLLTTKLLCLALVGCASTDQPEQGTAFVVPDSFLQTEVSKRPEKYQDIPQQQKPEFSELTISSMDTLKRGSPLLVEVPKFASSEPINVALNEMAVPELAHYVFGDLLKLSYVIASDVERMREKVALNLQQDVTPEELFQIVRQLLAGNQVSVYTKDNILYVNKANDNNRDRAVGIGREQEDLPPYGDTIVQLVPFIYNSSNSILNILGRLSNVKAVSDFNNRLVILEGNRSEVERALQIVNMMDVPSAKGRDIRMLSLVYLSPEQMITQIQELMNAEGISVGQDISLVPLARLNSVVVYASNSTLGNRVSMWARKLDVATGGEKQRFYVYRPQYAKAKDIVESVSGMLQGPAFQDEKTEETNGTRGGKPANTSVSISADESQNAIIVQASPSKYYEILNLIEQLDRLPGQVAMQVIVAEVDIGHDVQMGIDWFYNSQGMANPGTSVDLLGTLGKISLTSINGNWRTALSLLATKTDVKVLSRPYLVVRDGGSATINSGKQVPVLVETVSSDVNPDVSRNSIQYRNTGISLSVTPTINADGLVSLEISQESSNSEAAGQGQLALAPIIVSRNISTSILAADGQTVILGGLIQENTTENNNKVPFFGSIPLIGNLFQSKGDKSSRTELLVMITPRIIRETSELDEFGRKLSELYSFPVSSNN